MFPVAAVSDADQLPASGMGSAAVAATTAATIMTTGSPHPQTPAMDSRKGKTRTSINPRQLEILQAAYERDSKPSRAAREEMASQTGLTMKVIQVWFQNRRSKDKKDGVLKEDSISAASPAATPGQNASSIGTPMGIGSAVPENGVAMLHQAMQSKLCLSYSVSRTIGCGFHLYGISPLIPHFMPLFKTRLNLIKVSLSFPEPLIITIKIKLSCSMYVCTLWSKYLMINLPNSNDQRTL